MTKRRGQRQRRYRIVYLWSREVEIIDLVTGEKTVTGDPNGEVLAKLSRADRTAVIVHMSGGD